MKVVLHIFNPDINYTHSGAVIRWKSYFENWEHNGYKHSILNTKGKSIESPVTALNLEISKNVKKFKRIERFKWIFMIIISLIQNRKKIDIIHCHSSWWGGMVIGFLGQLINKPTIFESVLFGSDNPSALKKKSKYWLKKYLLKKFNKILTVSDFLSNDFIKNGFDENKVFSLVNNVNHKLFNKNISKANAITIKKGTAYQIIISSLHLLAL